MTVMVLHIPRTGGMSRVKALADVPGFKTCPHRMRLSDVAPDDTPVLYVRDPVSRFISAYDHLSKSWVHDLPGQTLLDLWPTPTELALHLDEAWTTIQQQTWVFRPQTWWAADDPLPREDRERVTLAEYQQRVASSTRWVFTPQAEWFDTIRTDVVMLRTESMDMTLPALARRYGHELQGVPHENGSSRTPRNTVIERAVGEFYADDYALLEWADEQVLALVT